jgi:hypothetical protein
MRVFDMFVIGSARLYAVLTYPRLASSNFASASRTTATWIDRRFSRNALYCVTVEKKDYKSVNP